MHHSLRFGGLRHICFDDNSLDAQLLTRRSDLLRGLDAVEVIDCNVAALGRECGAEEFAETTTVNMSEFALSLRFIRKRAWNGMVSYAR